MFLGLNRKWVLSGLFLIQTLLGCVQKPNTSSVLGPGKPCFSSASVPVSGAKIPQRSAHELNIFSKNFANRFRLGESSRNYRKIFQKSLVESVQEMPVLRSQLIPVLQKIVHENQITCESKNCTTIFETEQSGLIPLFEEARLSLLKDLGQAKSQEAQALLVSTLAALADDGANYSKAAFTKALVVGKSEPPISSIKEESLLDKKAMEALLSPEDLSIFRMFSAQYMMSYAIRADTAIPAPGQSAIKYPFPNMGAGASEGLGPYLLVLMNSLPKVQGTVFRAMVKAPQSMIKDLQMRAYRQLSTGLYYGGASALSSSSRDSTFANNWLTESRLNNLSEIAAVDPEMAAMFASEHDAEPLLLVINQKSGRSIENIASKAMKEILLPPVRYKVIRFENRSLPVITEKDPRWPNAAYVVYMEEDS